MMAQTAITPAQHDDLTVAREVLTLEAQALTEQAAALDGTMTQVLDIITACQGRVIISGMGKAGHIGKKATATLASTGTPCHFVHPAEASHGDLGMINEKDVVIILSKSGESAELRDMVDYCKRFRIPLIAITANPQSSLGRQADHILQLVGAREACPNQQAPTTSTTLMLGLCDALAIALIKRRGFSANDFRQYHPGGKLGGQLLAVKKVMQQGDALPIARDDVTVAQAVAVMSAQNLGCAILTDAHGALSGFLTDGDLRRNIADSTLAQRPVTDIMSTTPQTISDDALASAALAVMNERKITQLVVVNGNKPVGLVRLHDIMTAGVA